MLSVRLSVISCALLLALPAWADAQSRGILLLAHGGNAEWNGRVTELAARIDRTHPTEVAFGMATRSNIQAAVDRLAGRGVTEIVAVPLFISSWSSVITSTEYLLGQREEAPAALAAFAKMDHSRSHGAAHPGANAAATTGSGAAHSGDHGGQASSDATAPISTSLPIRMTPALNDHPIVAEILSTRAQSISRDPATESIVIVAHGPTDDDQNRRWLADMASVATRVKSRGGFATVDYLTLRDDAPKPVRDRATAELREIVRRRTEDGRRVLVIPLLLSFGGIEEGLRERLEGLAYAIPSAGLMPDDRLMDWVLEMAAAR